MCNRTTLTIGAPFSANQMYSPSIKYGMVKSKKYRKWIEHNITQFQTISPPISFPVEIDICVFGGRGFGQRSDVDNIVKPIGDLLVKAKILPDDNYKYVNKYTVRFMDSWHQKGEATTVITIIEPEI